MPWWQMVTWRHVVGVFLLIYLAAGVALTSALLRESWLSRRWRLGFWFEMRSWLRYPKLARDDFLNFAFGVLITPAVFAVAGFFMWKDRLGKSASGAAGERKLN